MTKILFISSEKTGGGHKSITKALIEQLVLLSPDMQFTVIDGFKLGNWLLRFPSRIYDFLAVEIPALWGFFYRLSNPFKALVNQAVAQNIRKSLLEQIQAFHPDLIVSDHDIFVGSIIKVLKRADLDIPVISLIADLDNVTNLWVDKDAKYIICPSEEVKQSMLKEGIAEDHLYLTGFPVRSAFCDLNLPEPHWHRKNKEYVSVLLISGSQGSTQVLKIANTLLKYENIRVTIIAGHNTALKKFMEKYLSKYIGNRVTIYGFIKEVKERMMEADILILRASPNVLMEAVNLCKPVIITGALRGQEEKNPQFVLKHHLGVYCPDIGKLPDTMTSLLENDGEKLIQISKNQYRFRKPEAARDITKLLIQTAKENNESRDRPIA